MHIKKLFKYLPITVMTAGLAVATIALPLSLSNNTDHIKNQVLNPDRQVANTDYNDQLKYIKNDIAKQTGVTNSVASIKLVDKSFVSKSFAAIAVKTDGSTLLYMWGDNRLGQLGNGSTDDASTPIQVPSKYLGNKKIVQIALGNGHSAALLEDRSLYMWGDNRYGQLGNGTEDQSSIPKPIDSTNLTSPITEISLGKEFSAALLNDGSVWMWGLNDFGQLGFTANGETSNPAPKKVNTNSASPISEIALGGAHSAALDGDGILYMWGYNEFGQLGFTANNTPNALPAKVIIPSSSSKKIDQITLGEDYTAALLDDDSLYMWGFNSSGQLGNGSVKNTSVPTLVDSKPFGSRKIDQIALGNQHSAVLLKDGSLYMWGSNNHSQLGLGKDVSKKPIPTEITINSPSPITQIALGYECSGAILEGAILFMWGYNYYGQLGNGTKTDVLFPTPSSLGGESHIMAKSAITAQAAVDNVWVDNEFNLAGFKNSFNLINIPETNDQEITMDEKPACDNANGTLTMKIKIKFFYDENGMIVPNTTAIENTITGFTPYVPEEQNAFQWWWIIVGIGGAAIIAAGIWYGIKKYQTLADYKNSIKKAK